MVSLACQTLEKIRNDVCFDMFWDRVILLQKKFEVNDPILPRKRKALRQYGSGSEGHFHESPKNLFRQEYFLCLTSSLVMSGTIFTNVAMESTSNLKIYYVLKAIHGGFMVMISILPFTSGC